MYECTICKEPVDIEDFNSEHLVNHLKTEHNNIYNIHKSTLDSHESKDLQIELINSDKEDYSETLSVIENQRKMKSIKTRVKKNPGGKKRSWVWKYFERLNSVIFQCKICKTVLSIKGMNSNNMNRHIRNRHPSVFNCEVSTKKHTKPSMDIAEEVEVAYEKDKEQQIAKTIAVSEIDACILKDERNSKRIRSWIWNYFEKISATLARCKFCLRVICHGGSATGNMNRHIKSLHNEVYQHCVSNIKDEESSVDYSWIWKLFSSEEDENFFSCRICNFKCLKFVDLAKSTTAIIEHLKSEHGVISGDQIITETTEVAIVDENATAVDFLNSEEYVV